MGELLLNLCYCCLRKNTDLTLIRYNIQNEKLKALFQLHTLYLCYICVRLAKHAEDFMKCLERNYYILDAFTENTPTLVDSNIDNKPLIMLTSVILQGSLLNTEDNVEGPFSVLLKHGNCKAPVKNEPKDYNIMLENEEKFVGYDDLLKEEVCSETESIKAEVQIIKKGLKQNKKKLKKSGIKSYSKESAFINSEVVKYRFIHLNQEQIIEERKAKALNQKYLESMYKCEDCLKGFMRKEAYHNHLAKHTQGDYKCNICKLRYTSRERLLNHKKFHENRYKCDQCGILRVDLSTIKAHYVKRHLLNGIKMFQCSHCPKMFSHQEGLRKHLSYIKRQKQTVICDYCSKSLSSKKSLRQHMESRHLDSVPKSCEKLKHPCNKCEASFSFMTQLKYHSIKHSEKREYYCVECNKAYKSEANLKSHLKTMSMHVKRFDLPLQCAHCDKRFSSRRDLTNHTNRLHLNIRPHKCNKCDKAYVTKHSLNKHVKIVHEGYKAPRDRFCPVCNKAFNLNTKLKSHMRTHTGERPFQCSLCPANFNQSGTLYTHNKLVHLKLTRDGRPKARKS